MLRPRMSTSLAIVAAGTALPWWAWAGFFAFIAVMLAVDLGVFQHTAHEVKMR